MKFFDIKKSKPIEFESTKEYIRHLIKIEEVEKINGKFVKDNKVKILLKREANNDNKKLLEENNPVEQNKNIEQDKNEETVQQPAPESTPEQESEKEPEQQPVVSNQQKL